MLPFRPVESAPTTSVWTSNDAGPMEGAGVVRRYWEAVSAVSADSSFLAILA
jgi:hypothetical protein